MYPHCPSAAKGVTKSDTTEYKPRIDVIYVGTTGNLVVTINGVDVTYSSLPVGFHHLGPVSHIKEASTAAALVALWY